MTRDHRRRRRRADATALDTEFKRGLGLYDATMVVVGSMIGSGIFIVSADMARPVGQPRAGCWWPGCVTGALTRRGRALVRRARGDDAARRRPVRLPARGVLAAVGVPLRLDAVPGHPDRHDRGGGGRLRPVPRRAAGRAIAEDALPRSPPIHLSHRLRRVAVDGAAGRHPADRAADLDQHARPRLRQDHPERLHDGQDRRAARADRASACCSAGTPRRSSGNFGDLWTPRGATSTSRPGSSATTAFGLFVALCVAQTGSLFSADAWNNITFTAGEVKDPRRNIPLSLALGTGIVIGALPAGQRRLSRDAAASTRSSTRRRIASPRRRSTRSFPASARRSWRSRS